MKKDKQKVKGIILCILLVAVVVCGYFIFRNDTASTYQPEKMNDPSILSVPTDGTRITRGSDIDFSQSTAAEEILPKEAEETSFPLIAYEEDSLKAWYGTYIYNSEFKTNYYLVATWDTKKNSPTDYIGAYLGDNSIFFSIDKKDKGFVSFKIKQLKEGMYHVGFLCDAMENVIDARCAFLSEDEYDTYIRRYEEQKSGFETAADVYSTQTLREYFDSVIEYSGCQFYEIDSGVTKEQYKNMLTKNARNDIYSYVEW